MKMDMLSSDIHDDSDWRLVARCVSMMEEFIAGTFVCQSYQIDQIDKLNLDIDERQTVNTILQSSLPSINREYIGIDDGKVYFMNRTS